MRLKLLQKNPSKKKKKKNSKAIGDLIGNKITNKIMRVSKNSRHNNSQTVTNKNHKEIPKGRYISPEKKARNQTSFKIKIIV